MGGPRSSGTSIVFSFINLATIERRSLGALNANVNTMMNDTPSTMGITNAINTDIGRNITIAAGLTGMIATDMSSAHHRTNGTVIFAIFVTHLYLRIGTGSLMNRALNMRGTDGVVISWIKRWTSMVANDLEALANRKVNILLHIGPVKVILSNGEPIDNRKGHVTTSSAAVNLYNGYGHRPHAPRVTRMLWI